MKTSLTCLGILIAALILGKLQGSRLAELKQQLPPSAAALRSKSHQRESSEGEPVYRSKYQRTLSHAVAGEVYQSLLEFRKGRKSTITGELASMTDFNKDALKAVLQLDLSGLEELIQLISLSKDPVFGMSVIKYEQITLCIIAMADQDPGHALDYVLNAREQMNPRVLEYSGTRYWLEYVLTRLGDRDPQRALDGLVAIATDSPETLDKGQVQDILRKMARRDPALVLEAIDRLSAKDDPQFLNSLTGSLDNDDDRTGLFLAFRDRYRSRPEWMKAGLAALCGRFSDSRSSPAGSRKWAESLGMSDAEKLLMFDGLYNIQIQPTDGKDYAVWFSNFMPKSPARDRLVWQAINEWGQVDETGARAFFEKQGIDAEEMMRREMGGVKIIAAEHH